MRVLMVAAECGALPGGKVGGMGDVLADLPPALSSVGVDVHVLLPSYGVYAHGEGQSIAASFAGSEQRLTLHRLPVQQEGVVHWVLDHPMFADPAGQIYHHDALDAPFATDANLYALFCAGVVSSLREGCFGDLDVLHLHDWHAAGVLLFRSQLNVRRVVYSIHNLGLQGQRPIDGHPSSLASWFGDLEVEEDLIDPRYSDCYNPMRAGILRADRVNTVSPTYAREVLRPDTPFRHGGAGLEKDLASVAARGHLVGILNGCDYPGAEAVKPALLGAVQHQLDAWIAASETVVSSHYLAQRNLDRLKSKKKKFVYLTSVTRATDQKVALLKTELAPGVTALDTLLKSLPSQVIYVLLGTGDRSYERWLSETCAQHPNFVYLKGFSSDLADQLYRQGDLFLMPSSYEPCGISQMLAMRSAQPCLVHGVGGLADTVRDDVDGFVFYGSDAVDAANNMLERLGQALDLKLQQDKRWREICAAASGRRFLWADSARRYVDELYL